MAAPSMSSISNPPTLPPFLKQSKSDIHTKFIDLEWAQRNRFLQGTQAADPPSPFSRLAPDLVTARNRYANVEPYALNRIKLKVKDGANDYINASPIQLGTRRYIATQGPKDTSVNHFYRMLAAEVESPAVVVMLTQTHEAGREKCFQYYPLSVEESPMMIPEDADEEGVPDGFKGEVHLESKEEDVQSRSQLRKLRLKIRTAEGEEGEEKETEIHHLLFSGWPDFLIPEGEDRTALIELIRLSTSLNRPPSDPDLATNGTANGTRPSFPTDISSNPRIIHCSAGVGRSGTFIALDYLLSLLYTGQLSSEALEPADKDPIADTVDELRQQRMMMVQGESQFGFLYEVLKELYVEWMQQQDTDGEGSAGAGAEEEGR